MNMTASYCLHALYRGFEPDHVNVIVQDFTDHVYIYFKACF